MINVARARALLRQAMETQGEDFKYNPDPWHSGGCFYRPLTGPDDRLLDNCPGRTRQQYADPAHPARVTGCLIGTALTLAGETIHLESTWIIDSGNMANAAPGMLTEAAARYLRRAQAHQDAGGTWGEALARAEAIAEECEGQETEW